MTKEQEIILKINELNFLLTGEAKEKYSPVLQEVLNMLKEKDEKIEYYRKQKVGSLIRRRTTRKEKKMRDKLRVMISQPMRGKTNEQIRQERAELVKRLEKDNFEVVDTIISENAPKGCNEAIYYLSKSIEFISKVDIVYFMKGWQETRGCKIENKICQDYGRQVMYDIYEEE